MRLVVFGQAPFGQRVLAGLQAAGHEIALVFSPPDVSGRVDPLTGAAREAGLRVETPANYKGPDVLEAVTAAQADLGVLAFVTRIIPEAVIDAPGQGSICYHPSLLPRYRGGSALAWQLIRGESLGGFSIFWTDAGVDSGPILLQREVPIGPNESAGSWYFSHLFEPSVAAVVEAVQWVAEGRAPRIPQDESQATHDPLCRDEHAEIQWILPVGRIHDLVRGCDPQPGAFTRVGNEKLRFYGSRVLDRSPRDAEPGTVLEVAPEGLVIACGSGDGAGALAFAKARGPGGKGPAAEVAGALEIVAGTRLGAV